MSWDNDNTVFDIVVNGEEQYSIWPTYEKISSGWRAVGKQGKKVECLAYIGEVWTDMRPLSLRKVTDEAARHSSADASPNWDSSPVEDEFVDRSTATPDRAVAIDMRLQMSC